MKIPDNVYEILKWTCLIFLPASAFLYGQLADIWHLPLAEQIPSTINLVATFIGILIGVSTYSYKKENDIIVKKKVEVQEDGSSGNIEHS